MGLKERISRVRNRGSEGPEKRDEKADPDPRGGAAKRTPKRSRTAGRRARRTLAADARKATGALTGIGGELLKLGHEMLVIPAQLWIAAAEIAGAAVLFAWLRALRPVLVWTLGLIRTCYRFALRHVTPARAVTAVCLVALGALVVSQWLDYRSISVGNDAYSGGLEAVAPAPDIARDRAGDAHAWAMVPLAVAGLVVLVLALTGRPRSARLLILVGAAVVAIAVAIDAPKGLDAGQAAVAYEGVEARLLEGFWLQIAAGAVLIAAGLLLPRYLRPASATSAAASPADRRPPGGRRLVARGVSGAST